MTLQPGEVSGEYGTDHGDSDQTLYVLEGQALVEVEGHNFECSVGDVFIVEAGENRRVSVVGKDCDEKFEHLFSSSLC